MSHTHKWHNLKKYGTIVKILFSHAERFESCTTTTRNEYLKSIFCLYSTHSIYPELKFQIHFLSLCTHMILRPSRDPSQTDWSVDASFGSRFESRSPGLKVKMQRTIEVLLKVRSSCLSSQQLSRRFSPRWDFECSIL